jgi:hypothetical protein
MGAAGRLRARQFEAATVAPRIVEVFEDVARRRGNMRLCKDFTVPARSSQRRYCRAFRARLDTKRFIARLTSGWGICIRPNRSKSDGEVSFLRRTSQTRILEHHLCFYPLGSLQLYENECKTTVPLLGEPGTKPIQGLPLRYVH